MSQELLLEVKNLSTHFYSEGRTIKAVDNISFNIYRGETVGIVGESGSGKSVTSLSIMRLIPWPPGKIVSGQILYHDSKGIVDLATLPEKEMRRFRGNDISMIFQEPMTSLNPVFTCGSQVDEAIMLHQKKNKKQAKELTLALFQSVQLPDPLRIYKAYPHELSGGQKQRVMIAMAMSCNPDILIADEPTTALDVTVQKTILDLMAELKNKIRASIMFITHDLGVIADIADRVLVMYKGHIVEQGTVLDIFENPQHPYTKGLMACRPPLQKRLKKLPVISDFMEEDADGNIIEKKTDLHEIIVTEKEIADRLENLPKQNPILKVEHLKTYFPTNKNFLGKTTDWIKAVDDVSLNVYPGETLGLVGESGCGKTTLGRTIIRLQEPTSGTVEFMGKDILALDHNAMKQVRKEMQIIFQDPYSSLNPRLTIGYAILEPMQVHALYNNDKQRKEKVIELLEKVNMPADVYGRYPHEFSGGQRQRICIARALALNPRFIICDESVSALDVSVQAQVLNLLMDLRSEFGFSYIFISHDLSVVKFMSDRMLVMNKGKIEEQGPADVIYNNPQSDYTKKLIEAIPKGNVEAIKQRLLTV
ncbi:MAG: ABC transporter ATP-binding protein [Chitinophagales bacterium]|nr:ABC transporter ATP-binding protein [Chitinophagales bacterium]MBP8754002.1 ABC transporter ATP-binding protein [Chitinophagales bacterium]MBP9188258.1 ABC transporter ATP-binding protein [Chitinophagales bacterium]MBP9549540.1 ABC transporter ATP-binding protein [Chitinophagales bacterium]MBP9705149.1 ABC transporter ATP-binding protein [Chitinophagales bacterium]